MQLFFFSRKLDTGDLHQDYVVELDRDINVCFGINIHTPDFVANTDWGLFKIRYNSDGSVKLWPISTGHYRFVVHGAIMHFCWFFLGLCLLITKRYSKWNWLALHLAHILIGLFVFVVTLYSGLKVMQYFDYHIHPDYHQVMGVVTIMISSVTSILGIVAAGLMAFYKGDKPWTDHDKARKAAFYHRCFGYFILIAANATCMAGLINYVMKQIKQE
jgi:hypothetical protein